MTPRATQPSVDDRSSEQKRHDILVGLVRAHAASGDAPVAGGEPPVLVLTGTIGDYDDYLRGTRSRGTLTIEHTGDLVPIETVNRLSCDAAIQRAIVDDNGHVLSLGRSERLFSRAQRRALAARDKGCRAPGCGMPAAWSEAHHIVFWQHGGPTDVDNGILVCAYHHHEIHAGRLVVERAGPARGSWRIVAQLRADRRVPVAVPVSTMPPSGDRAEPSPQLPASRSETATYPPSSAAAEAPRPLSMRLPEPCSGPHPDALQPARRRRRAGSAPERRLRLACAALRGRRDTKARFARVDLGPPLHIVMRT